MSSKDIEMVVDDDEVNVNVQNSPRQAIKNLVADKLRPYIGRPVKSATITEIGFIIIEAITNHFMDDFLKQKADEMKADIAFLGENAAGKSCVQGYLVWMSEASDLDEISDIAIRFERVAEEPL